MRVRATQTGFYGGSRRRADAEFDLKDPKHFSKKWMEKVADDAEAEPATEKGKPGKGKPGKEPTTLKDLQEERSISGKDIGTQSVI